MHLQGWLSLLRMLSPTRVVTASPVTCQAGLLAAILQHNDERFGLNPCQLVTFCVELPPSPRDTEWTKRHMKWWQMSHLCLHSVDAALLGYASMRLKATTSKVGLGVPGPSRLTAGATLKRMLIRHGSNTGSGTQTPGDASLAPPQGQETGGTSGAAREQVTGVPLVVKLIQAHGNFGVDGAPFRRPADDIPQEDSDDDGKSPSSDLSQAVLQHRNQRFFQKHSVKVQASSESSGHGLFAQEELRAETSMPCKGPWFSTMDEVQKFLQELPESVRGLELFLAP